ncbi:unnamed protein product, partial [Polarella glacialis]
MHSAAAEAPLWAQRAVDAARVHALQVKAAGAQVKAAVEQQVWQPLAGVKPGASSFTNLPAAGPLPPLEVRVCSWNLHGNQIHPSDVVSRWLAPDGVAADVLVIGVQELVDLGPRNMVMNISGDEQRQAALEARVEQALQSLPGTAAGNHEGFTKICSFGMVGLALLIYVRSCLRPYIRDLHCDRVKTGLDGIGGNKGGVVVRFVLGQVSVCFMNVHLASGQNAAAERNQHLATVLADAFHATSTKGGARPGKNGFERQSRYSAGLHHLSVILGDFNSRLDLPKDTPWPSGSQQSWLSRDQILLGQASSLRGFREGVISFPPTYKYNIGSSALNTKRCPAWCDRIVYKADYGTEVELGEYASFPDLRHTSDHHPVAARFQVFLASPSPTQRSERGLLGGVQPGSANEALDHGKAGEVSFHACLSPERDRSWDLCRYCRGVSLQISTPFLRRLRLHIFRWTLRIRLRCSRLARISGPAWLLEFALHCPQEWVSGSRHPMLSGFWMPQMAMPILPFGSSERQPSGAPRPWISGWRRTAT